MEVIIDKKNVVREISIIAWKRFTYITVDLLKKMCGMVRSMRGKRGAYDVGTGTDFTRKGGRIIKRQAIYGKVEAFNTYVPYEVI
jgi:hypothetical protein